MQLRNLPIILTIIAVSSATSLFGDITCDGTLYPTFPVAGKADCCRTWHIDIGLLYQQPAFPGMESGYSATPSLVNSDPYQNRKLNMLTECFDYTLGLTLSLGHMIEHDNWYFGSRFDYLSASITTKHDTTDEGNIELGLIAGFDPLVLEGAGYDGEGFNKIIYSASIHIYNLDFLLSRGSYHSKCFSYEPYAGVKALWFSTKQGTKNYSSFFADGNAVFYQENQHNWGAGPMFGFSSQYYFFYDLSFFSDCDIAVLYGENNWASLSTLTGAAESAVTEDQTAEIVDNIHCQLYIPIRTVLGIQFTRYCFEDSHYLAVKLGYDLRAVLAYPEYDAGFTMSGLYVNFVWNF